jgi:hypothetical protein
MFMKHNKNTKNIFIITLLFIMGVISLFANEEFLIQKSPTIQQARQLAMSQTGKQWSAPLQKDSLLIFPNPATGSLHIIVPSSATSNIWLGVYNVKGQLLQQRTFLSGNVLEISVREWAPATYFIKVEDRKGRIWSSTYLKM